MDASLGAFTFPDVVEKMSSEKPLTKGRGVLSACYTVL